MLRLISCCLLIVLAGNFCQAELPVVHQDDFESGSKSWAPTDAKMWSLLKEEGGNTVYKLHGKSNYTPPTRSPHSVSLLKNVVVSDFELTAQVQTLQTSRAHRDMCLFFNYQDASHFYYVHLGQKTDPHANQIFIVKDADRLAISEKTNSGTPWKDKAWHTVKLVRNVEDGLIEVYFDDMQKPQLVAHDKNFNWGQVGLGSFDDLGLWDDITLRGKKVARPKE